MGKLLVAIALVSVFAAFQIYNNSAEPAKLYSGELILTHQNWMQAQGKVYGSPAEQNYRIGIFQERLNEVIAHNSKPGVTWQMGLNQFSDMTYEELASKYLGEEAESSEDFLMDSNYVSDPNFTAPATADWRKFVPQVVNQKSCGSCWAFATAGTAEARYNQAKGKNLTFSPQ